MMTASLENAIAAAGGFSCGREWLIETQVHWFLKSLECPGPSCSKLRKLNAVVKSSI